MRKPSRYLFAAVTALAMAAGLRAADVKVENYSNNPIHVAQADNKGQVVSHGWTTVKSNEVRTFKAPDSAELYLRIQNDTGGELTFPKHQTFLHFPTHKDRFSVKTEPDDNKVWVLKHGQKLEQSRNANKNDKLPAGWQSSRFFKIGTGSHKLEIKP